MVSFWHQCRDFARHRHNVLWLSVIVAWLVAIALTLLRT